MEHLTVKRELSSFDPESITLGP